VRSTRLREAGGEEVIAMAATAPGGSAAPLRRVSTGSIVVFSGVVGLWVAFFVLTLAAPGTLHDAWAWLRDLPLLLEIGMWIVALPWALALAVWQSSWADWLQTVLIACFAIGWTLAFFPREGK
jgi:hypothetical protein